MHTQPDFAFFINMMDSRLLKCNKLDSESMIQEDVVLITLDSGKNTCKIRLQKFYLNVNSMQNLENFTKTIYEQAKSMGIRKIN